VQCNDSMQFLEPVDGLDIGGGSLCHTTEFGVHLRAEQNCPTFVEENEEGMCQNTSSNGEDEKVSPPRESKHVDSSDVDC